MIVVVVVVMMIFEFMEAQLQPHPDRIDQWLSANQLDINVKKYHSMCIPVWFNIQTKVILSDS